MTDALMDVGDYVELIKLGWRRCLKGDGDDEVVKMDMTMTRHVLIEEWIKCTYFKGGWIRWRGVNWGYNWWRDVLIDGGDYGELIKRDGYDV